MLVTLKEVLAIAEEKEIAIGAFNTPTLEMVRGVIRAAEALNMPVIIQHTQGHSNFIDLEDIGPIMLHYAKKASVPVCVHLDHGDQFDDCVRAMKLGFTSVMYDASAKDFEVNVKETAEIVKIAKALGVSVEAELGHMLNSTIGAGEGRGAIDKAYSYTDPKQALEFVERTQVDCLAVAVGTVHGIYIEKPVLNLERVKEIKDEVKIPLVLHGGSGLTNEEYEVAIKNGIRKINYYTYMNKACGERLVKLCDGSQDYTFFDELSNEVIDAVQENIEHAIKTFANIK